MRRRRHLLKCAVAAGGYALAAPFINRGYFQLFAESGTQYSTRCIDLMHNSLVIDMLSQFKLGAFPDVIPDSDQPTAHWWSHPETFTEADLARYQLSGINLFHIGWGTRLKHAYDDAVTVLSAWKRFLNYHAQDFVAVEHATDIDLAKRAGRIGILLGFQGADHFRSVDDIDYFYKLGQRVSQLTYNVRNRIGTGYEESDAGLSEFGRAVVARMNQTGMAIDLSHCGPRTTLDACRASKKPVLFTHANCRALNPHARCKSDAEIQAMAATGGVMGITSVRQFVSSHEPVTIENVLDHFDHVVKLVDIEHVGVGSDIDLDGYDKLPPHMRARMLTGFKHAQNSQMRGDIEGLNHPQRMFDLTEGLIRRKYSNSDIALILGGNFRRALTNIWTAGQPISLLDQPVTCIAANA